MKIASITMVGHFPDGIDLHVRNLKWFLREIDYHIYVVTSPKRLAQINVQDDKVTFISKPTAEDDFVESRENPGFVNFWKWFPAIIKHYNINPEWFLFMEQDLWFFEGFDCVPPPNTIKTFFSEKSTYHSILLGDRVLQPHLWEGTHLINAAIVNRAIDFKIDFGYRMKSLLDRNRQHYEKLFGDKLSISMWSGPETLTEFALYCALEERVGWNEVEKAVHLQGPELLHRKYPQIYSGYDEKLLIRIQREIPYIDVYAAIAMYYIAGNWKDCKYVDWTNAGGDLRRDLHKVALTADQWMTKEQHGRLFEVLNHLDEASRNERSSLGSDRS
jgi:hypothetical protein